MDTRERILDIAEQLFAEQGLGQTSLRAITAAAGVNLAAVHYHFGSKEALERAIFERRLKPMNEDRLRRLDALEANSSGPVPLADLVYAFIAPPLELSRDQEHGGRYFIRLLGRTYTEPTESLQDYVRELYEEVADRFQAAFNKTLPDLDAKELYWRLHFMVGTLAFCMSGSYTMRLIASSHLADEPTPVLIERLTRFLVGGLSPATALAQSAA
ncbi:MAG TPA: TetR/AcrR family transcriptional regulator [Gammaproteobacteria bacterium]|nr:TetR/AcrR family transcriptional regulator [Gammaproteobacteria bacterium]